MRVFKIFEKLRHTTQPAVSAVYKTDGYNIIIKNPDPSQPDYFHRHEKRWSDANAKVKALRSKGIKAEMRKVVVKDESEISA